MRVWESGEQPIYIPGGACRERLSQKYSRELPALSPQQCTPKNWETEPKAILGRVGQFRRVCLIYTLVVQMVKNLPTVQETWVRSLGREDPVEKEMGTHSSILA